MLNLQWYLSHQLYYTIIYITIYHTIFEHNIGDFSFGVRKAIFEDTGNQLLTIPYTHKNTHMHHMIMWGRKEEIRKEGRKEK